MEVADIRSQVVSTMEGLDLTDESEPSIEIVQSALIEAHDNLGSSTTSLSAEAR